MTHLLTDLENCCLGDLSPQGNWCWEWDIELVDPHRCRSFRHRFPRAKNEMKKKEWKYRQYKKGCATMLQKLSKCEVKAWLCWYLINLPPLWFCVKSNFGEFKRSKNVILGILKALNFDFSTFEQLSSPKFTKIKSSESLNLPKMAFLDL